MIKTTRTQSIQAPQQLPSNSQVTVHAEDLIKAVDSQMEGLQDILMTAMIKAGANLIDSKKFPLPRKPNSIERKLSRVFKTLPNDKKRKLAVFFEREAKNLNGKQSLLTTKTPIDLSLANPIEEVIPIPIIKTLPAQTPKLPLIPIVQKSPIVQATKIEPLNIKNAFPIITVKKSKKAKKVKKKSATLSSASISLVRLEQDHKGIKESDPIIKNGHVALPNANDNVMAYYYNLDNREALLGGKVGKTKTIRSANANWKCQTFEKGAIYQKNKLAPLLIHGEIFNRYQQNGLHQGALGFPIFSQTDIGQTSDQLCLFEKGLILFQHSKNRAFVISSLAMVNRYFDDGGPFPGSTVGFPLNDQIPLINSQLFVEGTMLKMGALVYLHAFDEDQAWPLPDSYSGEWFANNGELGYPNADITQGPKPNWQQLSCARGCIFKVRHKYDKSRTANQYISLFGNTYVFWQHAQAELGLPLHSTQRQNDWRYTHFEKATTFEGPSGSVFMLSRAVFDAWKALYENPKTQWVGLPSKPEKIVKEIYRELELSEAVLIVRNGYEPMAMPKKSYSKFMAITQSSINNLWPTAITKQVEDISFVLYRTRLSDGSIYEYSNGKIFYIPRHYDTHFGNRFADFGGPQSDLKTSDDGLYYYVEYQKAKLVHLWVGKDATSIMPNPIYNKWQADGAYNSDLGYPIGTLHYSTENGILQFAQLTFNSGAIIFQKHRGTFIQPLGISRVHSNNSWLGNPTSAVQQSEHMESLYQKFENGVIWEGANFEYYAIPQKIFNYWTRVPYNGENGGFGRPTHNYQGNPISGNCTQFFEGGVIRVVRSVARGEPVDVDLKLQLFNVKAIQETDDWGMEDEMTLTGSAIHPNGTTQAIRQRDLGSYDSDSNDKRTRDFSGMVLHRFPLKFNALPWPRLATIILSPVERDLGNLAKVAEALTDVAQQLLNEYLKNQIYTPEVKFALSLPAIGDFLEDILDKAFAIFNEILSGIFDVFLSAFDDEVFRPKMLTMTVARFNQLNHTNSGIASGNKFYSYFKDHGGQYRFQLRWSLEQN